jgi:hypothetical protein
MTYRRMMGYSRRVRHEDLVWNWKHELESRTYNS